MIAQCIELRKIAPALIPREPVAALKVYQIEALANGIMDAALISVRERLRRVSPGWCVDRPHLVRLVEELF